MKTLGIVAAVVLGLGAAYSTAALADDAMVTKAEATKADPAAPTPPATCGSFEDFIQTDCPLTWNGITLYGTVDAGVSWRSHGAPFNGTSAVGVDYLIQKYSRGPRWDLGPNGFDNSNIGVQGTGPISPRWNFTLC